MRHLTRPKLTKKTLATLSRITARVGVAQEPTTQAKASWECKPSVAFSEIRKALESMASGRSRCMYCEDSFGTDIDHFRPKVDYPHHAFLWENYLLACSFCNSNLKRTLFPLDTDGSPLLIDPTIDHPEQHLSLLPTTGEYFPTDEKGVESIKVFGLNDTAAARNLPLGRQQALICLVALLKEYDTTLVVNPPRAQTIQSAVKDFPFSAVLNWLIITAALPNGALILGADVASLVQKHRVSEWL